MRDKMAVKEAIRENEAWKGASKAVAPPLEPPLDEDGSHWMPPCLSNP